MKSTEKDSKEWSYKEWYANNSKDLSDRRRKRYEEDEEYRKKILEQNKAYRDKKAKEEAGKPRPMIRIPKRRKPLSCLIPISGVQVPKHLVHIGAFARAIQRSVPTIHQWERTGILPKTPFFVVGKNKQERLYTIEMIAVVTDAMNRRNGAVSSSDSSFASDILQGWKKAGIDVDAQFSVTTKVANG